jgi:hypothetical protein
LPEHLLVVSRRIKSGYWTGRRLSRRTPEYQKRRNIGQEDSRILTRRTPEYYTGRQLNIRSRIAKYWTEG